MLILKAECFQSVRGTLRVEITNKETAAAIGYCMSEVGVSQKDQMNRSLNKFVHVRMNGSRKAECQFLTLNGLSMVSKEIISSWNV